MARTLNLDILGLDLDRFRVGAAQRSGPMAVIPLVGTDEKGEDVGTRFLPPLSALKLSAVKGYGNMELEAAAEPEGVAIVPMQMGYIQDKRQNHALCASGFLGSGQKRMFSDANCVQQGQGGFLEGREQWFFVLPLALREKALSLRGTVNYGKLWEPIAKLNARFGHHSKGHLEQIVVGERSYFTQYASRFERLPGQTGALFFLDGELAGVELAPTAEYFAEVWMPLVCFCYGTEALFRETRRSEKPKKAVPLAAKSLGALRDELQARRDVEQERLLDAAQVSEKVTRKEEEQRLDLKLVTVESRSFVGQIVESNEGLVYASIGARTKTLGLS